MYYTVADENGKLQQTVPVQLRQCVMMHDIAITRNYSIILDFPLGFTMEGMQFDPSMPSRLGVLPRHARHQGEIQWFEAPAAFAFHVANAWEHTDSSGSQCITIVAGASHDPSMVVSELETGSIMLTEWVLNLTEAANQCSAGSTPMARVRQLTSEHMEFPICHPLEVGSQSQFIWFTQMEKDLPGAGCRVCKYDVARGCVVAHHEFTVPHQVGRLLAGECQFVMSSQNGDGGYLMTFVTDEDTSESFFYILNAATMEGVAVVALAQRVPFGFHGCWVSKEQIDNTHAC